MKFIIDNITIWLPAIHFKIFLSNYSHYYYKVSLLTLSISITKCYYSMLNCDLNIN